MGLGDSVARWHRDGIATRIDRRSAGITLVLDPHHNIGVGPSDTVMVSEAPESAKLTSSERSVIIFGGSAASCTITMSAKAAPWSKDSPAWLHPASTDRPRSDESAELLIAGVFTDSRSRFVLIFHVPSILSEMFDSDTITRRTRVFRRAHGALVIDNEYYFSISEQGPYFSGQARVSAVAPLH